MERNLLALRSLYHLPETRITDVCGSYCLGHKPSRILVIVKDLGLNFFIVMFVFLFFFFVKYFKIGGSNPHHQRVNLEGIAPFFISQKLEYSEEHLHNLLTLLGGEKG